MSREPGEWTVEKRGQQFEGHYIHPDLGAIRQIGGAAKVYDADYVAHYDQLDCRPLSELRFNHLVRHCELPRYFRLLDFGCGNGSFLLNAKANAKYRPDVFAHDISGYPLPPELVRLTMEDMHPVAFDVVTFFDSLEHIENPLSVLRELHMNYMVVSVPWCHARTLGPAWFAGWKHRKPGEHLWYFDAASLCELMGQAGFVPRAIGNPEDAIRKPVDHRPNILTGVFVRGNSWDGGTHWP